MGNLFIQQHNGGYIDAVTGSLYKIDCADFNDPNQLWWISVYNPGWAISGQKLGEGYADKEEAQNALDEFMSAHDVAQMAPPVKQEEQQADPKQPAIEKVDSTSQKGGK